MQFCLAPLKPPSPGSPMNTFLTYWQFSSPDLKWPLTALDTVNHTPFLALHKAIALCPLLILAIAFACSEACSLPIFLHLSLVSPPHIGVLLIVAPESFSMSHLFLTFSMSSPYFSSHSPSSGLTFSCLDLYSSLQNDFPTFSCVLLNSALHIVARVVFLKCKILPRHILCL